MRGRLVGFLLCGTGLNACCPSEARLHCVELRSHWTADAYALRRGNQPNQLNNDYSRLDPLQYYLVGAIAGAELGEDDARMEFKIRFLRLASDGGIAAMRSDGSALATNLDARLQLLSEICPEGDD